MHPNPAFRKSTRDENIAFCHDRSFGILTINGSNGPLVSHIPFLLSQDGTYLEAHLVRSNPIVAALKNAHDDEPIHAVMAVSGCDGYISPDWYEVDDQVPTWNYLAVHIRGRIKLLDQSHLHGILERLSAQMESKLDDKKPWTIDKMDQEIYAKMQRQIVPLRLDVDDIEGTWKFGQNKPENARLNAARQVGLHSLGQETQTLQKLMGEFGNEN